LQGLRWHYFEHIEPQQGSSQQPQGQSAPIQISVSAKKTNEDYCPYCDPLFDYI
jgi:hypothetical protein